MKIEFISEIDDENGIPAIKILDIDIDESSSIKELLSNIHEITKIPKFRELKWGDQIEKVSCNYYLKSTTNPLSLERIGDLDKQISTFPKNGLNGELSLFIDLNIGLAN